MHWAQRLGTRSLNVSLGVKVVDRVVLVPDAATYLDEIRKWSTRPDGGRWPVLIEDDVLAPMFVRRFNPSEVIRREKVATPLPDDIAQRRHLIETTIVGSLGGDPAHHTIDQLFALANYKPAGVVVASTNDPAWPAAVALAAARAQSLIWIDDDFGGVDDVMDDATARKLAAAVDAAMDNLHYTWRELGDDIDTITLCRNLPVAANLALPESLRLIASGQYADGTTAVTDIIGRHADGSRYAFAGWIFGDETRAAYMAMCSIFLSRENAALLNTYSSEGEWGKYGVDGAAQLLSANSIPAQPRSGPADMGEMGWARLLVGGLANDLVWMNTGGNPDFFMLNGGQAHPGDVPVLNQPAALHLIHSWSLRSPTRVDGVGGRWLAHGAYAMVGACFEPLLVTFMEPEIMAERCLAGAPYLVAARFWPDDPRSKPWRIVTIGDPLMVVPPKGARELPRLRIVADYGENLLLRAKKQMKLASDTGDPAVAGGAFAESIRILDMLGKDDIAIQMWTLALQKDIPSGRAASAALGPLFRARDEEGFMRAWSEGGPRNPLQYDMLWQLVGPRLGAGGVGGGGVSRDDLLQMEAAVRSDLPAFDVERLAPAVLRVCGKDQLREFLQREIAKAKDPEQQRQLREIAGKY